MQTEYFDIVDHNIASYTKELVARVLDGWKVSQTNPGDVVGVYGGTFTVSLYRNASTVDNLRDKADNVEDVARPDRAAILQKARDAKAAKKLAENTTA